MVDSVVPVEKITKDRENPFCPNDEKKLKKNPKFNNLLLLPINLNQLFIDLEDINMLC